MRLDPLIQAADSPAKPVKRKTRPRRETLSSVERMATPENASCIAIGSDAHPVYHDIRTDMADIKSKAPPVNRLMGEPLRQHIIDTAERLLRQGKAAFSMRDLASTAKVSFASPFNQFGSKAAIMHALAERRFDTMTDRFTGAPKAADAVDRVMVAVDVIAAVMLEEPIVNRSVMGWIGTAGPAPGQILSRSKTLFTLAFADGAGFPPEKREHALATLPLHISFGFRGLLSFWTAGEVSDEQLAPAASDLILPMVLGYADPCR